MVSIDPNLRLIQPSQPPKRLQHRPRRPRLLHYCRDRRQPDARRGRQLRRRRTAADSDRGRLQHLLNPISQSINQSNLSKVLAGIGRSDRLKDGVVSATESICRIGLDPSNFLLCIVSSVHFIHMRRMFY